MKNKGLEIFLILKHIRKALKVLTDEVEKIYQVMGDQAIIDIIKNQEQK